ncbi:MAG: LytR C-terminal domain-containing protein, partial [Mycobacterium sp.]|nr:LytR C-terminal domain-containing protein [Mycobacterium sp.]
AGWDVMDFLKQLQKLAGGNVAFATIPVLAEDGWSDDGMQSVVRVDPAQVQEWVVGLLQDQDQGQTAKIAYTPEQTTVDVLNDSDINGLAGAVSDELGFSGFLIGTVGNNDAAKVSESQVQAASGDDLGAEAVARALGGLPVKSDSSLPAGTVRVVLTEDYSGPGSGLEGSSSTGYSVQDMSGAADTSGAEAGAQAPLPSQVFTAGSEDPQCVN